MLWVTTGGILGLSADRVSACRAIACEDTTVTAPPALYARPSRCERVCRMCVQHLIGSAPHPRKRAPTVVPAGHEG